MKSLKIGAHHCAFTLFDDAPVPKFSLHPKIYQINGWRECAEVADPGILRFVSRLIEGMEYEKVNVKESEEERKKGDPVLSPKAMNRYFKHYFAIRNYRANRRKRISLDDPELAMRLRDLPYTDQKRMLQTLGVSDYIDGYTEVDFARDDCLFELQFGKYAFVQYDWEKLIDFIDLGRGKFGCVIVPMSSMTARMSSGVATWEQAMSALTNRRAEKKTPYPMALLGISLDMSVAPDVTLPMPPPKTKRKTAG